MSQAQENMIAPTDFHPWQQAQPILEVLASLSYQTGELDGYLNEIACSVSHLLELDWSAVTLCWEGKERVMASSIDLGKGEHIYSLHGLLTDTVVQTGRSLCVEDATCYPEYGSPPEGYVSYLGVPLRTSLGVTIGTICSFCREPRLFTTEEVRTVELFAERAATAIDNYNLYQKQQQFNQFLEAEVVKRTEELQETQTKLIERERLAAIGEFASMIVHEIRNPVTTILMGLNYCKKHCLSDSDRERIDLALDEAQRLQNLLKEILLYAKPHTLQLEKLEVNSLIGEMLPVLKEIPEAEGRELDFIPSPVPTIIRGDRDKLKQVLINLVRNACEAVAKDDRVTCKIERLDQKNQASISIHNRGKPIPAEILPKLSQPFCSTKPNGTGLGLAIVKRIVESHNGLLSIQSDEVNGTVITVALPFE